MSCSWHWIRVREDSNVGDQSRCLSKLPWESPWLIPNILYMAARRGPHHRHIEKPVKLEPRGWRGCSNPISLALFIKAFRTSMTIMKSIVDKGSPWRSPLRCWINLPGTLFTKILVVEDHRSLDNMLHYTGPKPKCLKTYSKNAHDNKSKALLMSNFRRILGSFRLWSTLAVCWTKIKLSWMHLPLTKALWLGDTNRVFFRKGTRAKVP